MRTAKRHSSLLLVGIATCAFMVGCGSSATASGDSGASSPSGPSHTGSPAQQLRNKLNAMTVPERLTYLKEHPGTTSQMMGVAPMNAGQGGSAPMAPGMAPQAKGQ